MTTITNHPDGSVTARDEATGIEGKCRADEASPPYREGRARTRLQMALCKHLRQRADASVQREMG